MIQDHLFYKGRLVIPSFSRWIPKLIEEYYASPLGGHSGAFRTYNRISSNSYWLGMMKQIQKSVAECLVCHTQKYEAVSPAGLLQLLSISTWVWEDIFLNFIIGLPRSQGNDAILVVVDRFTKYGHFLGL